MGMSKDIMGVEGSLHKPPDGSTSHKPPDGTTTHKPPDGGTSAKAVGELYFKVDRLRSLSGQQQTLKGFEKIQTVGKGIHWY